jgi:hypothetical protein
MFLVRRKNKSRVTYDTSGGAITFDQITAGGHSVYTAEVSNMVQKEISLGQMFDIFGTDVVLKAEFIADRNFCRLSVLEGGVYSHDGCSSPSCLIVTHRDMKSVMDSYPTGECVDAVLCASYKDKGALTLAPYVYDWKSLSMIPKLLRALIVGLILALVAFAVKDSTVKDFVFLVFMLIKDSLVPVISSLIM